MVTDTHTDTDTWVAGAARLTPSYLSRALMVGYTFFLRAALQGVDIALERREEEEMAHANREQKQTRGANR